MKLICGMDEAGRGPLAGPIVAAAVVLPSDYALEAVDSKQLSSKQREKWVEEFLEAANSPQNHIQFQYCVIEVDEINQHGIGWANKEVFKRLIQRFEADEYIVDGNHRLTGLGGKETRTQSVVRADQTIPIVAAAANLAKVYRDDLMRQLHQQYPIYDWKQNKGYGTRKHIQAIKTHGRSPYHRHKFAETVESKEYAEPVSTFMAKLFPSS